ncbi:MAG: DUF3267 domain-containing protein [Prevotella sp.]|nr:DUF3267 domain-containing protein [Prevotella sp.]
MKQTEIPELPGMRRRKMTIDIVKANKVALMVLLGALILFGGLFFLVWGWDYIAHSFSARYGGDAPSWQFLVDWCIIMGIMVVGIVVHELIHGITWACYAKRGFRAISYGVIWKMLTPYTHCDEPMRIRPYVVACLMPLLVLGIIPSVIAIIIGWIPLLAFGIFFIAGAMGDVLIVWMLRKENPEYMVLDHPSEPGYFIYEPEDLKV